MPMDPHLAAIYGTNADETDTEKLAAAKLAEELADDGEVETEELTDEQVEELAQQLLAQEQEEVEEPATEEEPVETAEAEETEEKVEAAEETEEQVEVEEPEVEKTSAEAEAQEKLAEADYLGRVMAHAYTQELRKIAAAEVEETEETEKEASVKMKALRGVVHAKRGAGKVMKHVKRYGELMAGGEKPLAKGNKRAGNRLDSYKMKKVTTNFDGKTEKSLTHNSKEALKSLGARGGTAAAAGGAAAAYKKHKQSSAETEEQISALDVLAERRALEILKENGIELEQPQVEETEKQSASEQEMDVLSNAVEQRAFEMLQAAGYIQEQAEEQEKE